MKTIVEYKNALRNMKEDVLKTLNEARCDQNYQDISLVSVEEDIALWIKKFRAIQSNSEYCYYFYTDIEGKSLFNGQIFKYATPFSNARACVNNGEGWYILDIEKEEMVSLPNNVIFENINTFRQDNLALLDKSSLHWGSITYNSEEKSFERGIPFIWDALDFSRKKEQVYVGLHTVSSLHDYCPYFHWDEDFGEEFVINAIELSTNKAKNLEYYHYLWETYRRAFDQNVIRYIRRSISSITPKKDRQKIVNDYLKAAYDMSDYYFEEEYKETLNNNQGRIVDVGNCNTYQKKKGIWRE